MQYESFLLTLILWLGYIREAALSYQSNTWKSRAEETHHERNEDDDGLQEQEIIKRVLSNYDWRVRPRGTNASNTETGGPVIVTVNILLRSISKIDDVNMEYSVQITFRETWRDHRLAFAKFSKEINAPKYAILPPGDPAMKIWMPDTFFQNEKAGHFHNIDKPNVMLRIGPNGDILYSIRLSLILSCPMFLEYYPLDKQKCLIDLASYAYTTEDIEYMWKDEKPVQLKPGLNHSLPSFELQAVETTYCTSKTNTGEYSCLRTELILRREFSYYLLQLYIPSFMLVIVSWVSFWLDKDSVPARVTLGVTTLLTMTTQSSGINAKLPPVSYTKAIDVWIGVCLAFIFGALLEFALVNYAARRDIMQKVDRRSRRAPGPTEEAMGVIEQEDGCTTFAMNPLLCNSPMRGDLVSGTDRPPYYGNPYPVPATRSRHRARRRGCMNIWLSKYKERSKRIDVVSRLVFPVGFFAFNCVYWTVYMV